jgi:hypothetical protein
MTLSPTLALTPVAFEAQSTPATPNRGSSLSNLEPLPLESWIAGQGSTRTFQWSAIGRRKQEQQVFDRLVTMKVLTANLAMHLDRAWRSGLFQQLDDLLDAEDWDFSDRLPSEESFRTLLRMVIYLAPERRPALGATSNGNIIAGWIKGRDRLTIECLPNDWARWIVVKHVPEGRLSAAAEGPVRSLREQLSFYDPEHWWRAEQVSS